MMQVRGWGNLDYWNCGECQVVLEKLNDIRKGGGVCCPQRKDLFRALQVVPFTDVRVMVVGQDPYPDPVHATGIAFDVPATIVPSRLPPTLTTIFEELNNDLHYPTPKTGSLTNWCNQGVLLWNSIPSCLAFNSLSHDWPEYHLLTKEIVQKLSNRGQTVFLFLGKVASRFSGYVEPGEALWELSHPSPRASRASKRPFLGSRIFSTINAELVSQGLEPIDWRL